MKFFASTNIKSKAQTFFELVDSIVGAKSRRNITDTINIGSVPDEQYDRYIFVIYGTVTNLNSVVPENGNIYIDGLAMENIYSITNTDPRSNGWTIHYAMIKQNEGTTASVTKEILNSSIAGYGIYVLSFYITRNVEFFTVSAGNFASDVLTTVFNTPDELIISAGISQDEKTPATMTIPVLASQDIYVSDVFYLGAEAKPSSGEVTFNYSGKADKSVMASVGINI